MQVYIDIENKKVTMSLEDFTNHFSGTDHQIMQQPILNLNQKISTSSNLEELVTSVLSQLGVSRGNLGFKYLREAIILSVGNPDIINYITKVLYPEIAQKFETIPSRAERAIRHVIEKSWNLAEIKLQDEIFGCSISANKGKATNTHFIAAVSDYMRLKLKS